MNEATAGEATATHIKISPRRKLQARQAGQTSGKVERTRGHPRTYRDAAKRGSAESRMTEMKTCMGM